MNPYDFPKPKPQTLTEWAAWFAEFKRRHGLTPERVSELTGGLVPKPPPDAKPPPPHHSDPEERKESE